MFTYGSQRVKGVVVEVTFGKGDKNLVYIYMHH